MARELVLMADYSIDTADDGQLPIWEDSMLIENDSVDFPEVLADNLRSWNDIYDRTPSNEEVNQEFIEQGRDLAKQVKEQLGEAVNVYFFNDLTLKREMI